MVTIKESICPPAGGYFTDNDVKIIITKIGIIKTEKNVTAKDEDEISKIAKRLSLAAENCVTIRNLEDVPSSKDIKNELESLQTTCNIFHKKLSNLSDSIPANYFYKPYVVKPVEFFDTLQKNVKLLNEQIKYSLKNKKTESKGGRPKINRVNFIKEIIEIYKGIIPKKAGISRDKNNRPTGPFFRFVKECLYHIGDKLEKDNSPIAKKIAGSFLIDDESIATEIKKAKKEI